MNHSDRRSVAVLGGGAGGQILAGIAAHNGYDVRLFSSQAARPEWADFSDHKTVRWSGQTSGEGELSLVSDCLDSVIGDASVVALSVPAIRHSTYLGELSARLENVEMLAFIPGNFGGERLLFTLKNEGIAPPPTIAETNTLPFSARQARPGEIKVHRTKRSLLVGSSSLNTAEHAATRLGELFSFAEGEVHWEGVSSLTEVALSNVNAILHVPLMLLNAGAMSKSLSSFRLIPDGLSPAVDRLISQIDSERLELGRALGIDLDPITVAFSKAGFDGGRSISEVFASFSIPDSDTKPFPDRRLTEEVPFALWPLVYLAENTGVACPALRATAQFADLMLETPGPGFPLNELNRLH